MDRFFGARSEDIDNIEITSITFNFKEQFSEIFIVAFHVISISSVKYTLTLHLVVIASIIIRSASPLKLPV